MCNYENIRVAMNAFLELGCELAGALEALISQIAAQKIELSGVMKLDKRTTCGADGKESFLDSIRAITAPRA